MGKQKNKNYINSNQFQQPETANEFYTTYEEVEYIFENLTEDFTNKIIYCPFDSEESNFVKYIKSHKDKLKYKDFWYTNDDWYNHLDLIQKADYIISNPPFSELQNHYKIEKTKKIKISDQGILRTFIKMNKKFFLFGPLMSISLVFPITYKYKDSIHYYNRKYRNFIRPDGTLQSNSGCYYVTNINNLFEKKKLNLTKSYKELDTYIVKTNVLEGLMINRIKDIPYDYDGWLFVPVSIHLFNDDRIIYNEDSINNYSTRKYNILNAPKDKQPYIRIIIKINNKNYV